MNENLYELSAVGVCYRHYSLWRKSKHNIWALRDLSFSIRRGETVGIIGRNGAGKTTILRLLAGILECDSGRLSCSAKVVTMLSIGAGFDNYLTGRENIGLNGRLLGMHGAQIRTLENSIVEMSGLGGAVDMPVRTYSTGMRARLGFSIAYHADPEVLLLDENLGVGDAVFQAESSRLIREKLTSRQQTAVIVSHSIPLIREMCSRVIWLEAGTMKKIGDAEEVTREYLDHVRPH